MLSLHKKITSVIIMATTEKYTTVIELNSEQAKREFDRLKKEMESCLKLESRCFLAFFMQEMLKMIVK